MLTADGFFMEFEIAITCVLLVALTFLSLVDVAFGELSDVGLRRMIAEGEDERTDAAASFLARILENRSRFRYTLTVGLLVLVVAVASLTTLVSYELIDAASEADEPSRSLIFLSSFAVALVLTALARQVVPRLIASRRPEATLRRLLPILRPIYRPLSFVAFAWFGKSDRVRRAEQQAEDGTTEDEDDGDDLQALIDVGEEEGIIEEEEGELIHSIIEFGDTRVNEVMTPRTEIVAVAVSATVREVRDAMVESKYSRLPVFHGQIDNVEGIVYVRDILQCWVENREEEMIAPLVRPTYFVPATKPVAELLEEMQKAHTQLAMVIDEYGGVAGLVTVEDILEEIVGEIEDEDTEAEEITEIVEAGGGYYEVLGSTEVGKIERLFDFEIEDDDFTTIAGLVINELGQVPRPGTRLTFRGLDVEVLEADERRIGRLRLRRAEEKVAGAE
jgi:CBS domain containing-hemolysin-like protein